MSKKNLLMFFESTNKENFIDLTFSYFLLNPEKIKINNQLYELIITYNNIKNNDEKELISKKITKLIITNKWLNNTDFCSFFKLFATSYSLFTKLSDKSKQKIIKKIIISFYTNRIQKYRDLQINISFLQLYRQ